MGKENFSFGKQILIPLASGVIGASCVLGINYGIQNSGIFINNNSNTLSSIESKTQTSSSSLISISNYSDTATSVAKTILPSVVGIKVEYSVSSIFYKGESTATAEFDGRFLPYHHRKRT